MALNVPKLVSKCEEFFLKELSVENCCDFYMDAINMCDDCSIGSELVTTCQSFIEENAGDVVQTQGFRNLSKNALTQLISSDKVNLQSRCLFATSRSETTTFLLGKGGEVRGGGC